ncbi:hypothetical protein SRAA_1473 [Serpentinimonas raichei]|uniref:Uncharacterized protein n=1 Tax=Serpentinimonas raichei TaxID=1458425 RepID=A0A060NIX3_9BURK|nr:hypothetical protein [Serpentinimonas raichei]BAO81327.1 hypothetical protein SRAA_1473 [Serpentinimonas raichei]
MHWPQRPTLLAPDLIYDALQSRLHRFVGSSLHTKKRESSPINPQRPARHLAIPACSDGSPGLPCRFPVESLAHIAQLIDQDGMKMFSLAGKTFVDAISHPDNAAAETQARMIAVEPVMVGIPMVDLHLAAAAEDIAWRNGIEVPAWALDPKRFAPEPQFFGRNTKMQQFNVEYTPESWRRRNLFFGEVVLWTHRWGETLEQRMLKIQSGALL